MSIVTLNDRGVRSVTTFGSLNTGSMVFIKKLTASSSGTLSFVDGASSVVLDSTYKEYLFTFKNIHPSADGESFQFQCSTDSGSNYNKTITSTFFRARHDEADSIASLAYAGNDDLAQSTNFQNLAIEVGNGNDECCSGYLHLFNPSSTTFVKHYISRFSNYEDDSIARDENSAGYMNTTSAIDAVQFKMSSGNIDAGDICLYGIL